MDITERIELLKQCGMADERAYEDMKTIVALLDSRFDLHLTEENGGMMVTHMAAVFQRNSTGEAVSPMQEAAVQLLQKDIYYPEGLQMLEAVRGAIQNRLSTQEQNYILLHFCTLLYGHNKKTGKEEKNHD